MEKTRLRWIWTLVLVLLLCGAGREVYGQRVYATNYGYSESGPAIPLVVVAGLVQNPANAIEPNSLNSNYCQLLIGSGLLGTAHATYQLEFISSEGNLPAGTSVYVRMDDNTSAGLLGLALATQGFVSAYKNSNSQNSKNLTGTKVTLSDGNVVVSGQYLVVTPSECFNAIRFSIVSAGLLGLLTSGNVRIYHAYIEMPLLSVDNKDICYNESMELTVNNPISSSGCNYRWYTQPTGGTLLGTGASFLTPKLTQDATYYVTYSGIDPVKISRKAVTVTVKPRPPAPNIILIPNSQY